MLGDDGPEDPEPIDEEGETIWCAGRRRDSLEGKVRWDSGERLVRC